jgi:hypothetical protein
MRNESAASAGPPALTAFQRRRRRAATVFAIAVFSFFLWPIALKELAPVRLDTVRLTGISGVGGLTPGGIRRRLHADAARPIVTAQATTASLRGLGLLGALPPGGLEDLQTVPLSEPPISADLPAFSTPASAITGFNPPSPPSGPDQGFPFVTAPGGATPSPPVVSPLSVDPPITGPVTPPVTPPDNPVTPPDPFVPPPVVPPIVAPFVAPPIDPVGPTKPILPDPGGPGSGTQGGGPVAGIPEPAVWLELVLGAGLAGAALRRARLQPATALRARSRA